MALPTKGEKLDILLSGYLRRETGKTCTGGETFISVSMTKFSIKHIFSSIIDSVECRSDSPTCTQLWSHVKQVTQSTFSYLHNKEEHIDSERRGRASRCLCHFSAGLLSTTDFSWPTRSSEDKHHPIIIAIFLFIRVWVSVESVSLLRVFRLRAPRGPLLVKAAEQFAKAERETVT